MVPVAGMAIGGALNWALIDRVSAAANDAYRERFLANKSGGSLKPLDTSDAPDDQDIEGTFNLIDVLVEEDVIPEDETD